MRDSETIEDSTILTMVNDAQFAAEIPCLQNQAKTLTTAATGCSACARRRQEAQRQTLAAIKTCLAGLSGEKQQRLKELLDTKQVKVVFISSTGQVSTITF
jgi:hypothetical protein